MLRAEYDVTDNVTFFADVGGGRTQVARVFGTPTITSYSGNTTNTPAYFTFLINRQTYDAGVRATFETMGIKHLLVMQALGYHDDISRGSTSGRAMSSNIYAPVNFPGQAIAAPTFMPKISSTDLTGFALSDTLSAFDDRIQLMLGIRQQRIATIDFSPMTGLPTSSSDMSAQPPMVGLVVKPWQNVSLYANYVQGLSKGETAPQAAINAGQVLPPYIATQFEAGIKADFGQIGATLAAFQIERQFGQLVNNVFGVGGQQRNQGLELNVFGEVIPTVRVLAGLTLLNATVTQTSTAFALGNRPIGVPVVSGTLTTEWDTPLARTDADRHHRLQQRLLRQPAQHPEHSRLDPVRSRRELPHVARQDAPGLSRHRPERLQQQLLVRRDRLRRPAGGSAAHRSSVNCGRFLIRPARQPIGLGVVRSGCCRPCKS